MLDFSKLFVVQLEVYASAHADQFSSFVGVQAKVVSEKVDKKPQEW